MAVAVASVDVPVLPAPTPALPALLAEEVGELTAPRLPELAEDAVGELETPAPAPAPDPAPAEVADDADEDRADVVADEADKLGEPEAAPVSAPAAEVEDEDEDAVEDAEEVPEEASDALLALTEPGALPLAVPAATGAAARETGCAPKPPFKMAEDAPALDGWTNVVVVAWRFPKAKPNRLRRDRLTLLRPAKSVTVSGETPPGARIVKAVPALDPVIALALLQSP